MANKSSATPLWLTYGSGHVLTNDLEYMLDTYGGHLRAFVVEFVADRRELMIFYVSPEDIYLDVLTSRSLTPKTYLDEARAVSFISKFEDKFTSTDAIPDELVPDLRTSQTTTPGQLRGSGVDPAKAFKKPM